MVDLKVGCAVLLLFAGGCMPLPKHAKAQLIVPHDCIVNIEVQSDTECRQNADGTGRMLCYNLKLNKKVGCEYIAPATEVNREPPKGR